MSCSSDAPLPRLDDERPSCSARRSTSDIGAFFVGDSVNDAPIFDAGLVDRVEGVDGELLPLLVSDCGVFLTALLLLVDVLFDDTLFETDEVFLDSDPGELSDAAALYAGAFGAGEDGALDGLALAVFFSDEEDLSVLLVFAIPRAHVMVTVTLPTVPVPYTMLSPMSPSRTQVRMPSFAQTSPG